MEEKKILTEEDLKKIKDNFNSGMDRLEKSLDNLMTDFNNHMDRLENSLDEANRWASLAQEAAKNRSSKNAFYKNRPQQKNKEEKGKLWWWLLIS